MLDLDCLMTSSDQLDCADIAVCVMVDDEASQFVCVVDACAYIIINIILHIAFIIHVLHVPNILNIVVVVAAICCLIPDGCQL